MTETTTTGTKTAKGKAPKKSAKPKVAAPKKQVETAAKPKLAKAPREDRSDWKTFALRMPASESAALHESAGPANASKVMRALAAAFVTGDRARFEAIVEEARKLQ